MGFFKKSSAPFGHKFVARIEASIWILIYGGLLALILGLSVKPIDDDAGVWLMLGGGASATAGVLLIYVRSRLKTDA